MVCIDEIARQSGRWAVAFAVLPLAACAQLSAPGLPSVSANSKYVAMGSSYASGPGVTVSADRPPNRCQRSVDNYAHQLARKRHLDLIDVSCGGATTENILGPWRELAPQIDAIKPDTRLVTVTIGGNDVGFVGGLMAASCEDSPEPTPSSVATMCKGLRAYAQKHPQAFVTVPTEAAWTKLEGNLDRIAQEVRHRAPQARLIFVEYIRVVPEAGSCATVPLSGKVAAQARATALRLAQLTAAAARRAGAGLIQTRKLSRGHDACAKDNWATGFVPRPGATQVVAYHPDLAAMTAIADALDKQLGE